MRAAFVLDSPSWSAVNEGSATTTFLRRFIQKMAPKLKIDYFTLLDEPAPKSETTSKTMQRTRDAWGALEPQLSSYSRVIGFGKFSSWHITGYTCDAAWGQPVVHYVQPSGLRQLRWGFYDLENMMDKRGVLKPMLGTLLDRVSLNEHLNPFDKARIITDVHEAYTYLSRSHKFEEVALDIENNPATNQIMRMGLAWRSDDDEDIAISVPWDEYDSGRWGHLPPIESTTDGVMLKADIIRLLANARITKIGQNINHDVLALEKHNIAVVNTHDTMADHHVLYPDAPHSLGFLGAQYSATPPWKKDFKASTEEKNVEAYIKRDPEVLAVYNAKDCLATLWAHHALQGELQRIPHGFEHSKRTHKLFEVARKMSRAGIMWDDEAAKVHDVELSTKMQKCTDYVNACAQQAEDGFVVNMNSTAHLKKYFFGLKQVEPKFFTAKGAPSINEDMLASLKADPDPTIRNVAHAVLEYREASKLKGSYLVNARECVKNGRVHPDVRPYGAKTGRWSIKDPAIQTIPEKMRNLYRAPEGKWLIYPDFSQLELRVIAALAKDVPLLEAFESGIRVHTKNAMDVFQEKYKPGDKDQERQAKVTVFTINYGGSASTIYQRLITQGIPVTLEFCERLLSNWYKAHPALKAYLEETYERARKDEYIELPVTKRHLKWWRTPRRQETANWPIQSTGADIMDRGIIGFAERIDWVDTLLIGQIHDAMLVETNAVLATCELLQQTMYYEMDVETLARTFRLKFNIGFNVSDKGGHWGKVTEYKSIEAVRKAAAEGIFS